MGFFHTSEVVKMRNLVMQGGQCPQSCTALQLLAICTDPVISSSEGQQLLGTHS